MFGGEARHPQAADVDQAVGEQVIHVLIEAHRLHALCAGELDVFRQGLEQCGVVVRHVPAAVMFQTADESASATARLGLAPARVVFRFLGLGRAFPVDNVLHSLAVDFNA